MQESRQQNDNHPNGEASKEFLTADMFFCHNTIMNHILWVNKYIKKQIDKRGK